LKTVYVDILGDTLPEPDERFSIVLLQPSMALLGASSGDVMIANDDAVSKAFIADMVIDEGNDGIKSIPVTVTFDNPASGSSKLQVRLVGATAVADEDFRSYGEILYPPVGAIDMGFTIQVLGDTMPECDEGFYIEYTAIGTGDDVTHRAKVLLRDDDGLVPGCPDPFAAGVPAEIPRDGGLVFVPPPDGSVDLGGSAWPDVQPVPSPDTMPLPSSGTGGSTASASVGTGGSTSQPSGFANRSGCSCSIASGERPMGFVLLGLAGVLVASSRRRRSRS
jgi:MYXO-CTERM domain-containing protein